MVFLVDSKISKIRVKCHKKMQLDVEPTARTGGEPESGEIL